MTDVISVASNLPCFLAAFSLFLNLSQCNLLLYTFINAIAVNYLAISVAPMLKVSLPISAHSLRENTMWLIFWIRSEMTYSV